MRTLLLTAYCSHILKEIIKNFNLELYPATLWFGRCNHEMSRKPGKKRGLCSYAKWHEKYIILAIF